MFHTSTHPPNIITTCDKFTGPPPALVLQAINAGVRRSGPGNEATGRLGIIPNSEMSKMLGGLNCTNGVLIRSHLD